MDYHHGLKHSNKILNKLFEIFGREEDGISIKAWSNCREQGYCVNRYRLNNNSAGSRIENTSVVFAEARNSDDIVVVWGPGEKFDIQTNQPSEELWQSDNRAYFSDDDEAASHIAGIFIEEMVRA